MKMKGKHLVYIFSTRGGGLDRTGQGGERQIKNNAYSRLNYIINNLKYIKESVYFYISLKYLKVLF